MLQLKSFCKQIVKVCVINQSYSNCKKRLTVFGLNIGSLTRFGQYRRNDAIRTRYTYIIARVSKFGFSFIRDLHLTYLMRSCCGWPLPDLQPIKFAVDPWTRGQQTTYLLIIFLQNASIQLMVFIIYTI